VTLKNTKYGSINAWVRSVDAGYIAFVDRVEYPGLPVTQASPGGSLAMTIEEAVEQLRQALDTS
jgi:hypothetical protein